MIRHYTATGLVLQHGEVLLVRHRKHGWWMPPGGHVEPNEDPVQAVLREIREEVGIDAEIVTEPRLGHPSVTVLPSPFTILVEDVTDAEHGRHQHIDMIYVCRPGTGEVTVEPREVSAYRWVPVQGVATLSTPPDLPGVVAEAAGYVGSIPAGVD